MLSPQFWTGHQNGLVTFCFILLLIARSNLLTLRPLGSYRLPQYWPSVSILVPARNEEANIGDCLSSLLAQDADLLTLYVKQDVVTWAEKLVVPVIVWAAFSFLPLALAYRLPFPSLSVTIGQFMHFRRSAYDAIGGYPAVRDNVLDDMALGRLIKSHLLRWRMANGVEHVHCRMYRSAGAVFGGISKNLFGVFNHSVIIFVLIWVWLGLVFLEPLAVALLWLAGLLPGAFSLTPALKAIALALVLWAICLRRFHLPLCLAAVYPAIVAMSLVIAARSLALTVLGASMWKGRRVVKQHVRWL